MSGHLSSRARRVDAGLLSLAALLGALFLLDSQSAADASEGWHLVVDAVVGALACSALLLRRRWPVAVAVVLIPSFVLSASSMGATAVALGAVAAHRFRWVTAAVLGLHAATVAVVFALVGTDTRELWQGLVVVFALDAALVASGLLVRSQRLLVQSLRERARDAEQGNRLRVEEARHAERERIAREMHDVLAHRISLLAVHAGALEVRRCAPEEERRAAGVVRQCAYEALEELREVIGMLRDDGAPGDCDRPQPTLADIPELIEESRLAGAQVTLDSSVTNPTSVPDSIGRHAYRVVQEGLTNARKHAPAAAVRVRLSSADQDGAGLVLEVVNSVPDRGAVAQLPGAGSGLIGLRERMTLIGGTLEHTSTPDGGFRLRAWIPLRHEPR